MLKNPWRPTKIHHKTQKNNNIHKTQNWWPTETHRFTTKSKKTTASTTRDLKTTPQNPKLDQISATTGDSREEIKPNLSHNPPNQTNNIHQSEQISAMIHDPPPPQSIGEKKEREPVRREEKKEKMKKTTQPRWSTLNANAHAGQIHNPHNHCRVYHQITN